MPNNRVSRYVPPRRGLISNMMAVGRGAYKGYKMFRKTQSIPGNQSDSGGADRTGAIHGTYNIKTVYKPRRKRVSRRVVRRARRFNVAVNKVIDRQIGSEVLLTSPTYGPIVSSAGAQTFISCTLAGGNNNDDNPDLITCRDYFVRNSTSASSIPAVLRLSAMQATFTFGLLSTATSGVQGSIYHWICRKSTPYSDQGAGTKWADTLSDLPLFGASGATQMDATIFNTTPFMARQWCQHFKVVKVEQFQLAPGNQISFNYRIKKEMRIAGEYIADYSNLAGVTRGWLVVVAGGLSSAGLPVAIPTGTLIYNCTRSYTGYHLSNAISHGGKV